MVSASPRGSTQIYQVATGGESLLSARALAVGTPIAINVSGQSYVEIVQGGGQYSIEETISVDLPVVGTKAVGAYLSVSQSGNTLTLTPTQAGYLHDLVGIG